MQVYGDPLEHPQTESYWGNVNPIGERSCYDEGKRVAETLAFDYQREHGIEVCFSCITTAGAVNCFGLITFFWGFGIHFNPDLSIRKTTFTPRRRHKPSGLAPMSD